MSVKSLLVSIFCTCLVVSVFHGQSVNRQSHSTTAPNKFEVSGPFVHDNLAVYLLQTDKSDEREFITLNEGLKSGKIVVAELESETVNTLLINNNSDMPLFLQEGDRVTGGKQDRIIYSSMVIAANSKSTQIPAFCIEANRWQKSKLGRNFTYNANVGYASNSVRFAGKISKNQSSVWNEVSRNKEAFQKSIGTKNSNSSLNESVDSKKVVAATKAFKEKLGSLITKNPKSVGVAFAVNGELIEVNAFPGNKLASKIYPRMLETYALEAIAKKAKSKPLSVPTSEQVVKFMNSKTEKLLRQEKVDSGNQLMIMAGHESAGKQNYRCETTYGGKLVHQQWLRADKDVANANQFQAAPTLNIQPVRQTGNQSQNKK